MNGYIIETTSIPINTTTTNISIIDGFNHLVLNKDIFKNNNIERLVKEIGIIYVEETNDLEELCNNIEIRLNEINSNFIDFISIEEYGELDNLIHYTYYDNVESIESEGFKIGDFIPDLGKGVYAVEYFDNDNVSGFIDDLYSEGDKVAEINISYKGFYTRCIIGAGHEGYIVIKEPHKIEINEITEINYN